MTLWKTSITSKLLEIDNLFFHTRRARLRGEFSSNKAKGSHLTFMTLWFWQVVKMELLFSLIISVIYLKQPLGMTSILVLLPHWSSVSHGSCFYFFQNFQIFKNIFNQHFYETTRKPNKLFVYLKDDWMFSQHWATCWWHRPSVG